MKWPLWTFVLATAALAGAARPGQAQGPVLVRDIATDAWSSAGLEPSPPVRFKNEDYFSADDGFLGAELWATNGTSRGTRLVADLCPGRCAGGPQALTPSGSFLFFLAANSTNARNSFWLWRSDGSAAGTFPLVDLELQFGEISLINYFKPFHGGVIFLVRDRERRGWSLWSSDGTHAGTRRIVPLPGRFETGSLPVSVDWPRDPNEPDRHVFVWRGKLWATDGTAAGTGPVGVPIRPCLPGSARLGRLVVYAGGEAGHDCEPWVSDGTVRGTRRLRDVVPGDAPSYPAAFVAAGGWVYFVASDGQDRLQLWKTDGTPRGTALVSASGSRGLHRARIFGATGARIFFIADDGEHGLELWRSDGTPATTQLVADLAPGAAGSFFSGGQVLGKDLFFVHFATDLGPATLLRTQGTAGSTVRLTGPDGFPLHVLSVAGRRVYFTARVPEAGQQLAVSDGTPAGTRRLTLVRPAASSNPQFLIAGPGGLVFDAFDGSGTHLWRSTGAAEDTERFAGFGEQTHLTPGSGGMFYYTGDDWRFGWTDGRSTVDLLPASTITYPDLFIELGDRTLFFAGRWPAGATWQFWIWSSDGTPEGTVPIVPAVDPPGLSNGFQVLAAPLPEGGGARYLTFRSDSSVSPPSATLSTTDGTAAGTRELVRFTVRPQESPRELRLAGRHAFVSFQSFTRASLWASDGTAEGTREVYAIDRAHDLSFISALTAAGRQAFFVGDDFEHGRELWASDGTPEGTRRVADLAPGASSSSPTDLAAFGDRVLFSADDGTHGRELWVSDGTADGTRLLEILPGPRGSYPQAFQVVGDRVVFAADDGVHGLEMWVTDGTPEGTRLAADVLAGPLSSSPRGFTVYGDDLFFNAGRPQEGYELWKLPLAELEP